jgi:hypothetical protein
MKKEGTINFEILKFIIKKYQKILKNIKKYQKISKRFLILGFCERDREVQNNQ